MSLSMPVEGRHYLGYYHGPESQSQLRLVRNNHAMGLARRVQMQGLHVARHQSDLEWTRYKTGTVGI